MISWRMAQLKIGLAAASKMSCAAGRLPFAFSMGLPPLRKGGTAWALPRSEAGPSLERIAYTIVEFCLRNSISRPTYHRLRSQGLGPTEMRIGLNIIRHAEREWQRRLQKPQRDRPGLSSVP